MPKLFLLGLGITLITGCGPAQPSLTQNVPHRLVKPEPMVPAAKQFPGIAPHLPQVVIGLTYHDIIPKRTKTSLWFDCSVDELRQQIAQMKKDHVHFVSVDQLYAYLTAGAALPSRPVFITFADGYEGFAKYAVPILTADHIPVAQFFHTGYVGSPVGRPKMTWSQIKALSRNPLVTFGSETVSHPFDIGKLSAHQQFEELAQSKSKIQAEIGKQVLFVAYPNGHFSPESEAMAKKAGYIMGFSEHQRPANESDSIYSVNRYVHTMWRQAIANFNLKTPY